MTTRLCLVVALAASCSLWHSPALAQVILNWPVAAGVPGLGARCADAPLLCDGLSYFDPGTVEIFVYPSADRATILATSFAIDYPADWSLLDAELCAGTIAQGNLYQPGAGLRIEFATPFDSSRPVLRYIVSAPTVGRWQFAPGPGGLYGYWAAPGGAFHGYWGRGSHVDVGKVCGDVHLLHPCEFCEMLPGTEPSAAFSPPSLAITIPQDQVTTIPLVVTPGRSCMPIPNCGSIPIECYAGFTSSVPWLSFVHLGGDNYLARIDAGGLVPGAYHGSAEAEGRRCCQSVCWPVDLMVTPATNPVEDQPLRSTWGSIKSIYR